MNLVSEIEEYSENIHSKLNEVLSKSLSDGEKIELTLTLTITVPDMSELYEELGRVSGDQYQ